MPKQVLPWKDDLLPYTGTYFVWVIVAISVALIVPLATAVLIGKLRGSWGTAEAQAIAMGKNDKNRNRVVNFLDQLEVWFGMNAVKMVYIMSMGFVVATLFNHGVALQTVDFDSEYNSTVLEWAVPLGRGFGVMCNFLILLLFLAMVRYPIEWLTSTRLSLLVPFELAYDAHIVAAYMTFGAGLLHGILQTVNYSLNSKNWNTRDGSQYREIFGGTSVFVTGWLLVLFFSFVTATYVFRKARKPTPRSKQSFLSNVTPGTYRSFLWWHLALIIPFAFLFLVHGVRFGIPVTWKFLLVPLFFLFLHYAVTWVGVPSVPTVVLRSSFVEGDIIHLDLLRRSFRFKPGQYASLHVDTDRLHGESHPFTIASAPDSDKITFVIKAVGDWTQTLAKEVDNFNRNPDSPPIRVTVSGPFGAPAQYSGQFEYVVLSATNVGATPFLSVLADLIWRKRAARHHLRDVDNHRHQHEKEVLREGHANLRRAYGLTVSDDGEGHHDEHLDPAADDAKAVNERDNQSVAWKLFHGLRSCITRPFLVTIFVLNIMYLNSIALNALFFSTDLGVISEVILNSGSLVFFLVLLDMATSAFILAFFCFEAIQFTAYMFAYQRNLGFFTTLRAVEFLCLIPFIAFTIYRFVEVENGRKELAETTDLSGFQIWTLEWSISLQDLLRNSNASPLVWYLSIVFYTFARLVAVVRLSGYREAGRSYDSISDTATRAIKFVVQGSYLKDVAFVIRELLILDKLISEEDFNSADSTGDYLRVSFEVWLSREVLETGSLGNLQSMLSKVSTEDHGLEEDLFHRPHISRSSYILENIVSWTVKRAYAQQNSEPELRACSRQLIEADVGGVDKELDEKLATGMPNSGEINDHVESDHNADTQKNVGDDDVGASESSGKGIATSADDSAAQNQSSPLSPRSDIENATLHKESHREGKICCFTMGEAGRIRLIVGSRVNWEGSIHEFITMARTEEQHKKHALTLAEAGGAEIEGRGEHEDEDEDEDRQHAIAVFHCGNPVVGTLARKQAAKLGYLFNWNVRYFQESF